jgi:hypothetical protein
MPARTRSREAFVLMALVAVLVAVLVYQLRNGGFHAVSGGSAPGRPSSVRTAVARDRVASAPELRLAELRALAATPLAPSQRNPFIERPIVVPPPRPVVAPPVPDSNVPLPPPPPPPIPLKLVGIVQGSGRPIAALSDGRDVFFGREGDVVEGRYKIIKVNVESIDISYLDGRGQRRLGLTG